ncbi:MAG: TIGR03986 family CRISPR-associated RAMP protein [Selenomonadaceae bacterium]|nr:TIGR03986 family CRISPR-associated RAMP protein [Selenomonadaceae bacterium]
MANWKEQLGEKFGTKPPEKTSRQNQSSKNNSSSGNSQPQKNFSQPPTAPYNFVSLPKKVLPAQFQNVDDFKEHVTSAQTVSGEILLDIETLTPLFIGGNESKNFAPVGKPIIPGSSLRGMFKNIFKIVTCGAFRGESTAQKKGEDFNDEHIYFRCIMGVGRYPWTKSLNKLYNGRMIHSFKGKDGKIVPAKSARPGFLIHTSDNKIFIAPSIYKSDRKNDRILIREYEEKYNVTIPERNSSRIAWDGGTAYIITGSQKFDKLYCEKCYARLSNDEEKKKAGKQFIRFTKIDYLDWCREHWFEVSDEVLASYRHDRNRKGVDLVPRDEDGKKVAGTLGREELKNLVGENLPRDVVSLIPCHFLEERGQVTAFGHGQCFRIPYQRRISDAVKISGNESVDFADALFGSKELWASRVYFEDAAPVEKISTLETAKAHPLMQPNPTSYQLYLKQDGKGELVHWDIKSAQIRGYKLYWHKPADWKATAFELRENQKRLNPDKKPLTKEMTPPDTGKRPEEKKEPLTKDMTPLNTGNKFTSKIRFKNLSSVELGALMMIFDLNGAKNLAYKIGQGKPFGFGSVRITPKLFVENESTYTKLFDGDGWQNPCREKNPAEYLDAFKKYLKTCGLFDAWQKVMDELKMILDFSPATKKGWSNSVKQMSGTPKNFNGKETMELDERFKQRTPLPTIQTIFEAVK